MKPVWGKRGQGTFECRGRPGGSVPYDGTLDLVLPVSAASVERTFPDDASVRPLAANIGLAVLEFKHVHLARGQTFSAIAYLKTGGMQAYADEIRGKIDAVKSNAPTPLPDGFSAWLYPAAVSATPSCISIGQSCANPLGGACCAGTGCDFLSGLTCKPLAAAIPTPTPSPTATPTPTPSATPTPTPTPSPTSTKTNLHCYGYQSIPCGGALVCPAGWQMYKGICPGGLLNATCIAPAVSLNCIDTASATLSSCPSGYTGSYTTAAASGGCT